MLEFRCYDNDKGTRGEANLESVDDTVTLRSATKAGQAGGKRATWLQRTWSGMQHGFGDNMALFLMALPGLAHVILFRYVTLPFILIAFKDYRHADGLWGSEWVGLSNFKYLFGVSSKGWQITRNVLGYNVVFIVLGTLLSLAIAILLSEVYKSFFARFYQTSLFFPNFLSWVVVTYVGAAFLAKRTGMLNTLLANLGKEPIDWYSSPKYWPFILCVSYLWKSLGVSTIIYVASILAINPEYYEAASIDGASKWQQIIHITLPNLRPQIIILTLLAIGRIFNADFGLFYQMPRQYLNPVLIRTTDVIDTYVFRALRELGEIEMAAAAGFYQSTVGFILVMVVNWIVRKVDPDRALF